MKKYIGGYSILDLASTTIYADALGALKQDKPVLVYDTPECYFADTIKATTIDGDDVVQITKGGKTITIANDNTITNVGDIQNHLYKYFAPSVYLQTTDYGDIRGMWVITSKEKITNPNYNTFDEIKAWLLDTLNKCGLIEIINSDADTEFTGSIYNDSANHIIIEGYSKTASNYITLDFGSLSTDTGLELQIDFNETQLF